MKYPINSTSYCRCDENAETTMKVHMSNRHNDASEEDSDLDTMSESDGSSAEDEEEDGRRED